MSDFPQTMSTAPPWRSGAWLDLNLAACAGAYTDDPHSVLSEDLEPIADDLGRDSWSYLSALATLGAVDLSVARVAEPHVDALAILDQAGRPDLGHVGVERDSTFGVYAAQAQSSAVRLVAHPPATSTGLVRLSGLKPWCSLADTVTHALVTARSHTAPVPAGADPAGGPGGLYAVDLRHPGVTREATTWVPRGLKDIDTHTLMLNDVPAVPVGEPGWYLSRPGFAWGGIGVAAVWFGGAAALAGALFASAARREPDQIASMHLGHADRVLHVTLLTLRDAADAIDQGLASGAAGELLASRVRAVAAHAAETVVEIVGHALGPAPLAHDETHARRVADLTVYVRQHHAERDLARLGGLSLSSQSGGP